MLSSNNLGKYTSKSVISNTAQISSYISNLDYTAIEVFPTLSTVNAGDTDAQTGLQYVMSFTSENRFIIYLESKAKKRK